MRLFRRLVHWRRFRSLQAELIDELAFHRDMVERDLRARGMSPSAAGDAARRTMGNETFMREEARRVWLWPWLETVWQDARYALRGLRRNRVFTAGVITTLALGIGANASMFSLVDRLLLRTPALMPDPASVHRVYLFKMVGAEEQETGGQYARYADLAKWTTAFSQVAAFSERPLAVGVGDAAREMQIAVVSAGFFDFFTASPVIGRYFTDAEDAPPVGAPVVVLSHAMWETRFGSRTDAIGTTMQIGPTVYTIIGVAPAAFTGLWPDRPPAAFIPVSSYAASRMSRHWWTTYDSYIDLGTIVRRKPGVSIAAATADLTSAFRRSYQAQVDANPENRSLALARPRALAGSILSERGPRPSSDTMVVLWLGGVAVIVLLIACANVANLLLARALGRRREIAVRVALGVSRGRLITQLLTESMLLALLGGIAGIVMAQWGSIALHAALDPDETRVSLLTDARTLLFAAGVALTVGVFTGLAPIVQVRRLGLTDDLKSGGREGAYQRSAIRVALLVTQAALSVVLLVGAGLFVQSLRNARAVRLGFDADAVLLVDLHMRGVKMDSAPKVALRLRLLEAAATTPGVEHASLRESVPFWGATSWPLYVAGIDSVDKLGEFDVNAVSPDYFATMGTRILRGRGIQAADRDGARRVMVISESMGAALWPGKDPLGQCARIRADSMPCTYVVGIAETIHTHNIGPEEKYFLYYLPAAQMKPQDGGLFVRARKDPGLLLETVRRRLQREMPGASYVTVTRFADIIGEETHAWNLGASVFTAFGALALILAAVGLYSVIAYNVAQRKHELGVRMALGAGAEAVARLVLVEGVRFGVAGVVIGSGIALAAGNRIAPLLFNESPRDPGVFVVVTCALIGVTLIASVLPAFAAARLDPMIALRSD